MHKSENPLRINIHCNGQSYTLPADSTLEDLLLHVGRPGQPFALALNQQIVTASQYASACLEEGDCVDLVVAAQGG